MSVIASPFTHCSNTMARYMISRLPEGGEGAWGYDDGEGDD